MLLFSSLLLSIILSINILYIGGFYKSKKIFINKFNILIVSILTSLGTLASIYIGKILSIFLPLNITSMFGSTILCLIGIYFIIEYIRLNKKSKGYNTLYFFESSLKYKKNLENPTSFHLDNFFRSHEKESIILSISILFHNFLICIGGGIANISISLTTFFNFINTIIFFCISNFFINQLNLSYKHTNLICGILLLILGIYEIFI